MEALDGKFIKGSDGGTHHTICHNGTSIYTFGRGCSGQLGISENIGMGGKAGHCEKLPKLVTLPDKPPNTKVHSVCAGDNHTMALISSGQVYSWGYGEMAQLGHGKEKDENLPKLIKLDNVRVLKISAGGQHSGLIASD